MGDAAGAIRLLPASKIGRRVKHLCPTADFYRRRKLTRCAGVEANRRPMCDRNFSCGKTRFFRGDDVGVTVRSQKPRAPSAMRKKFLETDASWQGSITSLLVFATGQIRSAMVRTGLHLFNTPLGRFPSYLFMLPRLTHPMSCAHAGLLHFYAPLKRTQTAAMVCTSTRNASLTSRSTIRSVFGGYLPSGNIFGNSRNRNAMNLGMSCECTRYVVN